MSSGGCQPTPGAIPRGAGGPIQLASNATKRTHHGAVKFCKANSEYFKQQTSLFIDSTYKWIQQNPAKDWVYLLPYFRFFKQGLFQFSIVC